MLAYAQKLLKEFSKLRQEPSSSFIKTLLMRKSHTCKQRRGNASVHIVNTITSCNKLLQFKGFTRVEFRPS